MELAEQPAVEQGLDSAELGGKTELEADAEFHAGGADSLLDSAQVRQVERQGLLADDVFARLGRGDGLGSMLLVEEQTDTTSTELSANMASSS